MPKMIFRGASIRYVDIRQTEAGVFSRIHMRADWSEPVREEFGWPEIDDTLRSPVKLRGELIGSHMVLTPNGPIKNSEIQIEVKDVTDFSLVKKSGGEDGIEECSLNFIVRSAQEGAAGVVEAYLRVAGQAEAQLQISYQAQATTDGAVSEDTDQMNIDYVVDTEAEESATVAPMAIVGGNKPKRRSTAEV